MCDHDHRGVVYPTSEDYRSVINAKSYLDMTLFASQIVSVPANGKILLEAPTQTL